MRPSAHHPDCVAAPAATAAEPAPPAAAVRLATVLLFLYATALLAIGVDRDWRLLHEDNGALHTTLALSHLELGLSRTRGHALFFDPASGEESFYEHHPAALSLLLAAAFAGAGSDEPQVARAVVIAFHLSSLALFLALLRLHFSHCAALVGGLLFATLPMSAYFGRMVNYEAPCLAGVLLQLYGWARFRAHGDRAGLGLLAAGIALAGLVDWPGFFFTGAIAAVEAPAALRGDGRARRVVAMAAAAGTAVLALDLGHLLFATGSLNRLVAVASGATPRPPASAGEFLRRELAHGRRYLGWSALAASLVASGSLPVPAARAALLRGSRRQDVLARWLAASAIAATAYVAIAPSWAIVHAYWSFYFLPFATTALLLLIVRLGDAAATGGRGSRACAALLTVVAVEVAATSARTLVKRHGEPEPYAIRETAALRARALTPLRWRPAPPPAPGAP